MAGPAINPWRAERTVTIGGEALPVACTMHQLAVLLEAFKTDNLATVFEAWDRLNPADMRRTLEILAVDPAAARRLWPAVAGQAGLMALHGEFYRVVSGMTPEEMERDSSARKKLAALPAEVAQAIVAGLAANPATAHLAG